MKPAAPSQVTGVDEITRHPGASANCTLPVVVVSSAYVPFALAVNVPVTCRDPVTGVDGQPAPTSDRSRSPLTVRHDDVTVQVPTTSPPHADTLAQEPPAPPRPPELPAVPDGLPKPELQAPATIPSAIVTTTDLTFIGLG